MASRLLRRSGVALIKFGELLNWRPETIVQVGVGVNHEEVPVMDRAWPGVKFLGFEPHPDIYNKIVDKYPGELIQLALTDRRGMDVLHHKQRHADGGMLTPPFQPVQEYKTVHVPTDTLDAFVRKRAFLFQPILLWLDCEGSELAVLVGGTDFLKRVDVVNVELTSRPKGPEWCDPVDVHRLLKAAGFRRQYDHTKRSFSGQCDSIYVRAQMWKREICSCISELEEEHDRADG